MAAELIDGKAIAAKVRGEVAEKVRAFQAAHGRAPGLAVVRVGHDPASEVYVRGKIKASGETGMVSEEHHLPEDASTSEVLAAVERLNADPKIDGILVQLPLPKQVDEQTVLDAIAPAKDVDGFHLINAGKLLSGRKDGVRACTPFGIMRLLREAGCDPAGKRAVVIGRSNIVGKPMALLLLEANATVTVCHSRTRDLAEEVARADIVVAAIGRPELVRGAWIREGAYVIDVGMNRLESGKLVGDVEFAAAAQRAAAITPVPGGVGPMTIAMLLSNTVDAANARIAAK
ncbi:bifunctional methylenetetrahydrofolate dehydrogenase/methenyltetrahydrofolate cyclohydrolase FolD [Vulgatibacter incomptus]|uniref:Bifunctional protein FolD n=1 Tax=Vulgatibacter incomptus TaxID=1391653 RepID=A0A0K1P8S4_9BACT|nr:bifunctional methylenetetrahydrofolate dehydrogenase/methenyltetrahydrofolate cyclohydrolase FolD [Vulgatibacter incomptus]AKU89811.1 Methylenetetrahydrofolate dehydrogenase (NADP+) [Vulgatibacter incomptus]